MAKPGGTVANPRRKEVVRFLRTAADTGGELVELMVEAEAGGGPPPLHSHPLQEERFHVVSGLLAWRIGDREGVAAAGESATVAPGIAHTWWNGGDGRLVMRGEIRPALRFETFIETIYGLHRAAPGFQPRLIDLAVAMREFREEWVPEFLPRPVRSLLVPVLAFLGRRAGKRWWYPEFSPEGPVLLPAREPRHSVRREVLLAFLAPALIVSTIGFLTRQPELRVAAVTSIAGASALAALATAGLLRRAGPTLHSRGRVLSTVALAAGGGLAGMILAGAILAGVAVLQPDLAAHLRRLLVDLPLSGAIGSAIAAWRLHPAGNRTQPPPVGTPPRQLAVQPRR